MLKKSYSKTGKKCRVTFKLPSDVSAETAVLVGDFNEWSLDGTPMKRLKDGSFSATVSLDAAKAYEYRYLLDGARWENDWEADQYVANTHGTENSVAVL